MSENHSLYCVDLFCGAGGLTYGLQRAGIHVVAGVDIDPSCKYPYETNNNSRFININIRYLNSYDIEKLYPDKGKRILAGCAPCQPFSSCNNKRLQSQDGRLWLLCWFAKIIKDLRPDVVVTENVPPMKKHKVFNDFVDDLIGLGYSVWCDIVRCADYGVAQTRKRLILIASRHGVIDMIAPMFDPHEYRTVRQTIGNLPELEAGCADPDDRLHVASKLSPLNLKRIRSIKPGDTLPFHLLPECSKRNQSYGTYRRMSWDAPSPTITTKFNGFGNGPFGHPEQDRALSLREGALLQGFPINYKFVPDNEPVSIKTVAQLIGNAVPIDLAHAIGMSIRKHFDG